MSSDGFTLLGAIAGAPEVFPDIRAEAAQGARALVARQLKAKTLPLAGLRAVHDCIGAATLKHVVGEMKEAEVRGLVTRLDRDNAAVKGAERDEQVRHLLALAAGAAPVEKAKPAKAPRATARTPRAGRALGSPAFAAVWDGKDHDKPAKDHDKPAKSKKK